MSADEDLGYVYVPVETPTNDLYGGHRPGNNLFAESLVCVDLKTGQRKWHFQFVHHPIWNFDMSSAPILADVTVAGRPRKVVAVPSKQAWLYVFDRVTGEPIWPIEEKPVPAGDVPGEWYAPTQPHPPAKLQYARNFLNIQDDLIDFTPEMRAEATERLKRYKWAPTPFMPGITGNVNGLLGAITGGTATNWPGGGYDPELHIVFAPAGNTPGVRSIVEPPAGFSDIKYVSGVAGQPFREVLGPGDCCAADSPRTPGRVREALATPPATPPPAAASTPGLTVQGLPIVKPPYGLLAAINLDRGELMWQAPHGDTPDNIRNHPALRGKTIPKTGQSGASGVGLLVTKTLVIMGDPQVTTSPDRPRGAMLRAYDKKTGEQVGAVWMPAPQSGSPMTYRVDGRQYIIVASGGGNYSGEYIAYALSQ
jgi:quinoprotein glucose dehydrogenase